MDRRLARGQDERISALPLPGLIACAAPSLAAKDIVELLACLGVSGHRFLRSKANDVRAQGKAGGCRNRIVVTPPRVERDDP